MNLFNWNLLFGWLCKLLRLFSTSSQPSNVIRCIRCHTEYTEAEYKDLECCTACGSLAQPLLIEQDLILKINWQELRVLVEFALRAPVRGESKAVLQELVKRLAKHRPPNAPPLTLEEEFEQVRK